jgi:uncharacterized protein YndB with AHSA1/START domain
MSCTESDGADSRIPDSGVPNFGVPNFGVTAVERHLELPAPPDVVWDELPGILGDEVDLVAEPGGALRARDADGERVGVVDEADPGERLAFRWMSTEGDDAPSEVEITLERTAVGTMIHLRETRLDGAHLERSAFRARAAARAGA